MLEHGWAQGDGVKSGEAMKVGFIGLGRMGQGIAGRVLQGGHALSVYNRTRDKAAALEKAGAHIADSIAQVCASSEVVMTMLTDDEAVKRVALGEGGIVASLPKGAVHMIMGTHGVDTVRALTQAHASAGQILVAAPVLGRPDVAASGQLGIVAAGPVDAVNRCRPLFEVIGKRVFEAGTVPEGATAIKLANNFALGCAIQAMSEAFALVRKHGVAPQALYEVMTEGLFAAPAYKVYGKIIVDEAYDKPGFTTLLGLKDIELALAAGGAARVPLPSVNTLRDRLLSALAHGDGDKDWAVIAQAQARISGIE
jgi:3-hydroxyisobutyrate dehydrogenase-like beta-hydroxyacid dehydrogenase